jgi:hypothetical protein
MKERFGGGVQSAENGVNGVYRQEGAAYFYDPDPGITYRVTDPILATLGGTKGIIYVNGKEICIDTDWECDGEYASYFEPVGEATAPHSIDQCGNLYEGVPVCVRHSSFFNKTWFFATYVRHGVNARFTTWAAYPWSEIILDRFLIFSPTFPVFPIVVIGSTRAVGENFAEEAIFCWFNCGPGMVDSDAVCGRGRITDPDLDSNPRVTGNGPRNNTSSPNCP